MATGDGRFLFFRSELEVTKKMKNGHYFCSIFAMLCSILCNRVLPTFCMHPLAAGRRAFTISAAFTEIENIKVQFVSSSLVTRIVLTYESHIPEREREAIYRQFRMNRCEIVNFG